MLRLALATSIWKFLQLDSDGEPVKIDDPGPRFVVPNRRRRTGWRRLSYQLEAGSQEDGSGSEETTRSS